MDSVDESSVDEDGVLPFTANEGSNNVESELTIPRAGTEEDLVGVIEFSGEVDFAVGVLGDRGGAVEGDGR